MARLTPYKVVRDVPVAVTPSDRPAPPTVAQHKKAQKERQKQQEAAALAPVKPGQVLTMQEIRSRIAHLFDSRNYNPLKELLDMAMATKEDGSFLYDAEFRREIHRDLAQYVAPKLKASEISQQVDMSIKISVINFSDQTREEKNVTPADGPPIDV